MLAVFIYFPICSTYPEFAGELLALIPSVLRVRSGREGSKFRNLGEYVLNIFEHSRSWRVYPQQLTE